MVRSFLVRVHRWAGLAMALFLVIVGLTGSMLAFREELDAWLNPDLFTVAERATPALDGFALREKAAALYPGARFDTVPLNIEPGRTAEFVIVRDPNDYMASELEIFLDPYTGERLGARPVWSGPSLSRRNVVSFLYQVHFDLALPMLASGSGEIGDTILGVTALLWTIDCFVSLYLTLPRRRRSAGLAKPAAKSWFGRWKPAWLIRLGAGAFRLNFDIHRALGLWTWLVLLIFAWSSVAFNLNRVYTPVMHGLLPFAEPAAGLPARATPLDHPRLEWREAYATGHALLQGEARRHGFGVDTERYLSFDRDSGAYTLGAKAVEEGRKTSQTSVTFDADTGAMLQSSWPGSQPEKAGDAISRWLAWIHLAAVFGLPMQIFVFFIGLAITTLSVTGVYIWWRKRGARVHQKYKIQKQQYVRGA